MSSILNDVKKALDIDPSYTAFDQNVLMFINGTLSTLNQLGVGPEAGLYVTDATTQWEALYGIDPRWNIVRTYVYLSVRMQFDPPGTSFGIAAFQKLLDEQTWRISVLRDSLGNAVPSQIILDGGEA